MTDRNAEAAKSLAPMIIEWVEGGIAGGTDWRNGLERVIERRLARFIAPSSPVDADAIGGWEKEEKLTVEQAWMILCETPDITSPEEYPDHALITMEQLCSFMARAIAPQAPVSAVPVVKPLEWSETRDPTEEIRYTHVIAETPFGIYSIEWKAWRDNDPPCVYLNGDYVECCHNLDAAKNAAKTQLEQRILSALSPQPVTKPAMSGGAHQQSFDEVVENCLRIWFFNYDETADNSAYRVAMREIVKFVRSVSIEPTDRGAHVVRLTADQICQTPLIEELIPNDEEWALCECRQDVYDLMKKCVRRMFKVEEYASQQRSSALASPPPPAQADDGKDAEIEHLKLEMDGVDNAKEEIGRLLGLTEEFRWKRISAAIHEQKRLIRELVAALEPFSVEADTYEPDTGDSRDRVWNCDLTIGSLRSARAALAKAKAAGDPVRTEGEQK